MLHVHTKNGLTLAEVVVSVAILSVVALAIAAFNADVFSQNRFIASSLSVEQEGQLALNKFNAELRSASVASNGSYPLAQVSTSSITFFTDLDNDGAKEQVRYFLNATNTLMRGVKKPIGNPLSYTGVSETFTQVIHSVVNGTSTDLFSYYDNSYDGTTAALSSPVSVQSVRLVKVTVKIDVDAKKAPVPLTLTTQVSLRNLKDNL